VAGATDPSLVTHLGFEPKESVEAAVAAAEKIHGRDSSVLFIRNPLAGNRK
jgi:hypothetical protein